MANITIYMTPYCFYCRRAKAVLEGRGLAYEEIDVSGHPELRRAMMTRTHGRHSVPQIFVGDTHVGGARELDELARSGGLDRLLASA